MREFLGPDLYVTKLNKNAVFPTRGSEDSAGWDLSYCGDVPLKVNNLLNDSLQSHIVKVPTGLAVSLSHGTYGAVCSRSGLAVKHGIAVLNAPGIIDRDYRGEIQVILINLSSKAFIINPGDRIAQLIVCPYDNRQYQSIDKLDDTERGSGGFGSTGV